jgi:hypothetical protein
MPYAYRVTRVTIQGSSFDGGEEWSTGFYMGHESGDADLPNQQLADDIRAAWTTFFTAGSSKVCNKWKTELVKVSSIGTDGKSNAADTVYSAVTGEVVGTQPFLFPPQCALVATLTSQVARGVGAKGRLFLPGIVATLQGSGKITSTDVTAIGNNFKTFLTAVNASTATNNVVMLASQGSLNKDGTPKVGGRAPVNKAVTGLRIGDVYDTQRRRRNGLTETYTAFAGPF